MSRSMHRRKISNKYLGGNIANPSIDEFIYGDAEATALATGGLAELLKSGGQLAAAEQKKSDDAKKKAADEAAYKAAHADEQAAIADYKQKQKAAAMANIDAQRAMDQADAIEKDKNGPQHVAARKLQDKANLLAADAKAAAAKVAYYQPDVKLDDDEPKGRRARGGGGIGEWWDSLPGWKWIPVGLIGGGAVLGLGYKLFKGRGK